MSVRRSETAATTWISAHLLVPWATLCRPSADGLNACTDFQLGTRFGVEMMSLPEFLRILFVTMPVLSVKGMSYRRRCPFLRQALCPCFLCFHKHSGFDRCFFNIFIVELPWVHHPPRIARTQVRRLLSAPSRFLVPFLIFGPGT